MMNFLAWTLYLVAGITMTLVSSRGIIGCFRKVNFQGFTLVTVKPPNSGHPK